MKNVYVVYCFVWLLSAFNAQAQKKEIVKIWETEANLKVPESVLWDKENKTLYFSNIDGESNTKDHKGSIGKMNADGKGVTVDWVSGPSAPKGMGVFGGMLYVADVDEVVVIDIKKTKITQRLPVEGAVFLNDVTIGDKGVVYVSDMRTGKIHLVENSKVKTLLEKLEGVNGLLAKGKDLYLLVNGTLWKCDETKKMTKIADGLDDSTDGVEQTKSGDFIVSCWNGIMYYVKQDGTKTILLDTRAEKMNTADIGFDAEKNRIYVPTFFGNKIVAYELK